MLDRILAQYFTRTPQAIIALEVATHQQHPAHDKFRVSDAGKCHRMRYWKRAGKPGNYDLTLEVQLALQTGNLLHAFITHALSMEEVLLYSELQLTDDHRRGHLDAIVQDGDGRRVLYDFKTVGGKQMYYLKQESAAKPEHAAQALTYCDMFQAQTRELLDDCIVAYLSRDTFELLERPVSLAPQALAHNALDWETLCNYWVVEQTPPMHKPGAWECNYCAYKQDCQR